METGYIIINILAALMVVSSLVILFVKTPQKSAICYAVQAAILVALLYTMAATTGSGELWSWGTTSIFTKVIFVPAVVIILVRQLKKAGWTPEADAPQHLKPWLAVLITAAIVAASFLVVWDVQMPEAANVKPTLALGMSIFFIGIMGVISRRSLFKQIFCYCIMENAAHMTMAVLSPTDPSLLETGIATDAIFGTIIFAVLIYRLYKVHKSLDARDVEMLKG